MSDEKEPWRDTVCPYSIAGAISRLGPQDGAIVSLAQRAEQQLVPLPCLGSKCALFVTRGAVSGCAHTMQVLETNQLNSQLSKFLDAITEAQKDT